MSDIAKAIGNATTQLADLQRQRADLEASALAHEHTAREDRLKMSEIKKQMADLGGAVRQSQVALAAERAQTAAVKAQKDAEASLALQEEVLTRLSEKEKALDALLAKAQQPVEPAAPA